MVDNISQIFLIVFNYESLLCYKGQIILDKFNQALSKAVRSCSLYTFPIKYHALEISISRNNLLSYFVKHFIFGY